MTSCDLGQPNWCCICIATFGKANTESYLFLQNILAGRQQQKRTPGRFPILIPKRYFPDEKVIRSYFHRNEIPGFNVAVAPSGSVKKTLYVISQLKDFDLLSKDPVTIHTESHLPVVFDLSLSINW